jgi:hypothetical protein
MLDKASEKIQNEFNIENLILNWRASHAVAAQMGLDKNSKHLIHYLKEFRVDASDENEDESNQVLTENRAIDDFVAVDEMVREQRF